MSYFLDRLNFLKPADETAPGEVLTGDEPESLAEVVVTGSRVTGSAPKCLRTGAVAAEASSVSYFAPPVMVATDPGNERYDGKEVSPVKLTASEPVSTFAVDVDTGAYANARRFLTQGMMPPKDSVRTEEMINYFRYDYARPKDRSQPFSVTTDLAATPWNTGTRLLRIGRDAQGAEFGHGGS